jgi:hypothetical protein
MIQSGATLRDRIGRLMDIEEAAETALLPYAVVTEISDAVLNLRGLLEHADILWRWGEYEYAGNICERIERELAALRCREVELLAWRDQQAGGCIQ